MPGRALSDFRPFHAALLIPAGSDVSWTIHYTPNGTELTDRPEVGLTLPKSEPKRLLIESFGGTDPSKFAIPPNDGNYAPAPAEVTFMEDAELVWMSPHMHLRGKDMTYKLVFPDGKEQIVLNVPHYDFNWQLGYDLAQPIKVPKGTKASRSRPLRQLGEQQVQSRSEPDGLSRQHDLGRDVRAVLHRHGG